MSAVLCSGHCYGCPSSLQQRHPSSTRRTRRKGNMTPARAAHLTKQLGSSSSSLMWRLIWTRRRVRERPTGTGNPATEPRFGVEKRGTERPYGFVSLPRSLPIFRGRVNFKLRLKRCNSIHPSIHRSVPWFPSARALCSLGVAFQTLIQNNGFRNLLHRLAPLLALSLHGAIRIFLTDR
jgi:hypothetical protein